MLRNWREQINQTSITVYILHNDNLRELKQDNEHLLQITWAIYTIKKVFIIMVKETNEENRDIIILDSKDRIQIDNK